MKPNHPPKPELRAFGKSILEVSFNNIQKGWEQWVLLSADRHWDHAKSDHRLQKIHLEEALNRHAGILDFGDALCLMQGRTDRRSDKSSLREKHKKTAYFDEVTQDAAEFLAPYPFWWLSMGNHESAWLKFHESNPVDILCTKMKMLNPKSRVHSGGFSGWVVFKFKRAGSSGCDAIRLWYHHGYGGDAPVTKGVIQTNRQAVYLPDAQIVVSGHNHSEFQFPIPRLRITGNHQIYKDEQLHLKIPSYKDEYGIGEGGWEIERGAPPKGMGAVWLRFFYDSSERARDEHQVIKFDVLRAR